MPIGFILIIGLLFCSPMTQATQNENQNSTNNQESPAVIFENVWQEAKKIVYPLAREQQFFTEATYQHLKKQSQQVSDVYQLAPVLNQFLSSLDVSHTAFYHDRDVEFYLFRSMFKSRQINEPKVHHIGVQFVNGVKDYIVREVLDGYPASQAGLRRGDIIRLADGQAFHPVMSFQGHNGNKPVNLAVERNGKLMTSRVVPVYDNPSYAFFQAMKQSKKILEFAGKRVGYIHLWTGIHPQILNEFKQTIEQEFKGLDGIILDLRGGFGGAWYDYLDPFFGSREDYFRFTVIDKQGDRNTQDPPQQPNVNAFAGPMVVLINEGVRSGKESLAYQFKKSARATLVGTTTQGAFTAGRGVFNEQQNYFLFIASAELLLDNTQVEGVGIAPDIPVAYPTDQSLGFDPQLIRAKQLMTEMLNEKSPANQ